jgi:triacylglycerol lipase
MKQESSIKVAANPERGDAESAPQNECIFLTHGFGAHWCVMSPMAQRLRRYGYQVVNWGYRSMWSGVERHAEKMRSRLDELDTNFHGRLHIVAHSMGNVVARLALQQGCPPTLGRIVMVCPPNHGSHVASLYAPLFGWLSPSLKDIRDTQDSLVNRLDENLACPVDVGIIQATTDFVVKPESTRLTCAKDYLMLKGFHSSIVTKRNTAAQIHYFLQNGSFQHTLNEPS